MKLKYNDAVHGYWLDGKRCKSVTGVAKIAEDRYALDNWRKRMVALGLADSPELIEQVLASRDDRQALDDLAEQALVAAGGTEKAERGTAIHAITERSDRGEVIEEHEQFHARTWKEALKVKGIEIVPNMIERAVVFPKLRITGRFDRIGRIGNEFFIVDVKTGINAIRYPKSTAIQLGMYGNAPLIAVHGVDEDGNFETEEFLPMPPVNKRIAYVVYLDPDEGEYQVHSVNIRLGWQAVQQVILPALRWRDVNDRALVKRVA